MTASPLFVVDLAFQITGRGCVLVPGPSTELGSPSVRIGDKISLELPDGSKIKTEIRGLEMIKRATRPDVLTVPILLPRNITKEQVPVGTKVFLLGKGVAVEGDDA